MFHQDDKTAYIKSHWNKKIYRFERPPNRDFISEKGGLDEDDDDHLIYKFKLKMANTLSVMTNVLRNVVSKKRIRYKENGFDLDLAYISDNIIAMGYPADNLESIYRNRIEDVYKFLEEHHQDHYRIYNLCLERSYDKNKFHGRVALYPFEDHNPPTIELIQKFCNDVDTWLGADSKNVAAVHCKAGKGRTGTMICCYLLYSRQHGTPEEALAYYDSKRTKDRKGVTIPSQRRYVQYFSKLLQSQKTYEKCTLQFCEIRFMEAQILHNHGTVNCTISVLQDTPHAVRVETLQNFCIDFRKSLSLDFRSSVLDVTGDIRIELSSKPARKKIFHFWFNTYFISSAAETEGEGDDERYVYTLNKWEIDDVHKDKEHKSYPENFKVQLVFYKNAGSNRKPQTTAVSGNQTSSSSDYEFTNVVGNMETMVGRTFMSHNSYPITTAVSCAISPIAMSTQLNNSGSNLSYNCDQKSSSSSASVSSLVGGGSGSGSDSTKNKLIADSKLKMISNGNADLKLNAMSPHPPLNINRNVSGGGLLNENIGADSLVQTALSDYGNYSTANNIKQKLLRQYQSNQHQQQEQQQQYEPFENNAAVPPSKVSRGGSNKKTNTMQSKSGCHIGFDTAGYMASGNVNSVKNHLTNNGVLHANEICENDHDFDYDVERDADVDDDDDDGDDAEEDWESGESSAISLPHLNVPLNNDSTTLTTINHKTTTTTLLSSHASPTSSTNTPTTTTTTVTTRTINTKFSDTSNLDELTTVYSSSINSAPFTNTSTSSRCRIHSKSEFGGENDGNDCICKIVNVKTGDDGDDDNQYDQDSRLNAKPNGSAVMKRYSTPDNSQQNAGTAAGIGEENHIVAEQHIVRAIVGVPPMSPRNKFFSFALTKTRTQSNKFTPPPECGTTTTTIQVSSQKQPFFRRKSFKSASSSISAANDIAAYSSNNSDPTTTTTTLAGYSGLAPTSKQKLKIKLKRNRFKLAQKFQKLHNYLRTDPDDFCESLAKQTIVRRNSNCSLNSKNNKAIPSTKVKLPQTTNTNNRQQSATSPGGGNLSVNSVKSQNPLKACLSPSSLEMLEATQSPSSPSFSLSITASNASAGSSAGDCDLDCDCDDYYSSICDNQLSFDNSPCKSPRSLADIALMSGGGNMHMGSAGSFNAAQNSLSSSSLHQQRSSGGAQCSHNNQQHQQRQRHTSETNNNPRLPFVVNVNKKRAPFPHPLKNQHQQLRKQNNCKDIVVVAAKPAKTNAIGFNVTSLKNEIESSIDCLDAAPPIGQNQNENLLLKGANQFVNKSIINGFIISTPNDAPSKENFDEKEGDLSGTYFTPPTSESAEQEAFDSCSSNEASAGGTPFIFPNMLNELNNIELSSSETNDSTKILQTTKSLNLLILKNNSSSFVTANAADNNCLVTKSGIPSPDNAASLESMENIDDNSVASNSNGNNTAGTGTSSSGFSTSECCSKSSNSNGVCDCNPLILDLERFEASRSTNKKTFSQTITQENQIEQEKGELRSEKD